MNEVSSVLALVDKFGKLNRGTMIQFNSIFTRRGLA